MVHQPDRLLGLALGINAAERQLQLGLLEARRLAIAKECEKNGIQLL
jgi:hypothetical protein